MIARLLLLLTLMMGALVAALPRQALAQGGTGTSVTSGNLLITVATEFGGYYRAGRWVPILVTIDNRPRDGTPGDRSLDFDGILRLTSTAERSRFDSFDFQRRVSVPAFSSQRFVLYARMSDDQGASKAIEVRAASGRLLQRIPIDLQPLANDSLLMVTVADQMTRLSAPVTRSSELNALTRSTMPAGSMGDLWTFYDSADVLIFPQWPDGRMNQRRAKALRDWVEMGGTLVFAGGPATATYAAAGDTAILPVELSSSTRYRYSSLDGSLERSNTTGPEESQEGLILSDLRPLADAEVVYALRSDAGGQIPIMVRRQMGLGQVIYLACDLETIPATFRQALLPYWLAVMPVPNMAGWQQDFPQASDRMNTIGKGAIRPPNPAVIILICILYTAIVGPVNFLFLGMTKRIQLAWLTVPLIVFVFSFLVYTIGNLTKGGESILREALLYRGYEGQPGFEATGFVGVFTRDAQTIDMTTNVLPLALADSERWSTRGRLYQDTGILDLGGARSALQFRGSSPIFDGNDDTVSIGRWPLRTFDAAVFEIRGPVQLDGPVRSTVRYHSSENDARLWLDGRIVNATGMDFLASGLFLGGRGMILGELADGQSVEVNRANSERPWHIEDGVLRSGSWTRAQAAIEEMTGAPNPDSDNSLNRANAAVLLSGFFQPPYSGRALPPNNGKLFFVGIAQENSEPFVQSRFSGRHGGRVIATVVELNPLPGSQNFVIPPQLLQINVQKVAGDRTLPLRFASGDAFDAVQKMEFFAGGASFMTYALPFRGSGVQVASLQNQTTISKSDPGISFRIAPYDHALGTYGAIGPGIVLPNRPGGIAMPWSGRGWFLAESTAPTDAASTGRSYGSAEVDALRFAVRGLYQEP